jgi:glycosyltransferase involved in cell wall biosynthesis
VRILSISNCPLVRTQGSGYVICGYADGLRERGHEVVGIGPEDYVPLRSLRPAWRLRKLIGYTRAALRGVRKHRPEVVELWGAEAWLATRLLAKRQRRPLLVHRSNGLEPHAWTAGAPSAAPAVPGVPARPPVRPGLFDRMQRYGEAFQLADALTVVSQFDGAFARGRGYQPEPRLLEIDNPLDDSWLGRTWSPDRDPVVGFVGSWIPRKGTAALREAFALLARDLPECRFVLVGTGSSFAPERELPEVVPDRLRVVPHATRADLPGLYSYFSLLVQPSLYESFGLVSAEAMSCGTPVVATRTGYAASWSHGIEGWHVPFGDGAMLAAVVRDVLSHPAVRADVAQNAWRRAQRLRWSSAIDALENAYHRWLAGRAPA